MYDIFIDAILDSLKVLGISFIIFFILSFIENKFSKILSQHKKIGPLFGSFLGIIPQCGISVVASDLYLKKSITMGTLIAVFLSCNDESLPIIFANKDKWYLGFLLIAIKFIVGFIIGFIIDYFFYKNNKKEQIVNNDTKNDVHIGCCNHKIDEENDNPIHKHLLHPIIHSIKIFSYVLIINIIFGVIIYYIGEENLINFIEANRFLTPLLTTIIGLIPNCASSVIISELFVVGSIPFSALLSGLSINAGLGIIYLFKDRKNIKNSLLIVSILFIVSIILGYSFLFLPF